MGVLEWLAKSAAEGVDRAAGHAAGRLQGSTKHDVTGSCGLDDPGGDDGNGGYAPHGGEQGDKHVSDKMIGMCGDGNELGLGAFKGEDKIEPVDFLLKAIADDGGADVQDHEPNGVEEGDRDIPGSPGHP